MNLESTNAKGLLFLILAFAGKIPLPIYIWSPRRNLIPILVSSDHDSTAMIYRMSVPVKENEIDYK